MNVLCTFPGRHGDILWALPTVRAVSEAVGVPVDLQIAGEFAGLLPLLHAQPYLRTAMANDRWSLSAPELVPIANVGQPLTGSGYDYIFHLAYRGWPSKSLPEETEDCLHQQWPTQLGPVPEIDLGRPWITVNQTNWRDLENDVVVGFTEAWFELKLGIATSLDNISDRDLLYLTVPDSRWIKESSRIGVLACDWLSAAMHLRQAKTFFGDCSALHVLACAMGKPVILCEPMEGRWNPIFYPYGTEGPAVRLVRGNDGKPTFDARACAEALHVR